MRDWATRDPLASGLEASKAATRRRPGPREPATAEGILELQRTAGNASVVSMIQRAPDGPTAADAPRAADAPTADTAAHPQVKHDLLNLRGINLRLPDNAVPPPGPLSGLPAHKADPDAAADDPHNIWKVDLDLDIDPESAAGKEVARGQTMQRIVSGGKEADGTPLGLQLTNAAVNILANTEKGKELAQKMYLDHVSVTIDPTSGTYGGTVTFRFGGKK